MAGPAAGYPGAGVIGAKLLNGGAYGVKNEH